MHASSGLVALVTASAVLPTSPHSVKHSQHLW